MEFLNDAYHIKGGTGDVILERFKHGALTNMVGPFVHVLQVFKLSFVLFIF